MTPPFNIKYNETKALKQFKVNWT